PQGCLANPQRSAGLRNCIPLIKYQAGRFLLELSRKRTSFSGHQTPRLGWPYYHLRWCPESLNHYRAPDSKTALRPLTGLIARALSLTLSPVGRGNWSSGAAYSEVIEGPCLPEPPDSAADASKQNSRIRALPPLPPGERGWGRGPRILRLL